MDPNMGGKNAAIRAALAQQQNATNLRVAEIAAGRGRSPNANSPPIGDFGLAAALAMDPNKGGKKAAIEAALAQQKNATDLRIAELGASQTRPPKGSSENTPSDSYRTTDRFGKISNSKENYPTKDRYENLVNSQDKYATKDRFGNLVDSQSCYKTKDGFGNLKDSAGCSR